jgi:hypothetical protein
VPDVATARTIARTYITYTALARATTHFPLEREIVGRRGSHGCVRRTAHNEHAGRCTLLVIVATFTHFDHVGRNQVRVTARVPASRLTPATYRLRSVLADARGAEHAFAAVLSVRPAPRSSRLRRAHARGAALPATLTLAAATRADLSVALAL